MGIRAPLPGLHCIGLLVPISLLSTSLLTYPIPYITCEVRKGKESIFYVVSHTHQRGDPVWSPDIWQFTAIWSVIFALVVYLPAGKYTHVSVVLLPTLTDFDQDYGPF